LKAGDRLPEQRIELTPTLIIATALASRDFEPVHHDRDAAQAAGLPDIFLNIFATNGFVLRLVTDWAGADAIVECSAVRLGVPAVAGDTLVLSGEVTSEDDGRVDIGVSGTVSRGEHVAATVTVRLPA
jgi:acyl dehydratase